MTALTLLRILTNVVEYSKVWYSVHSIINNLKDDPITTADHKTYIETHTACSLHYEAISRVQLSLSSFFNKG